MSQKRRKIRERKCKEGEDLGRERLNAERRGKGGGGKGERGFLGKRTRICNNNTNAKA